MKFTRRPLWVLVAAALISLLAFVLVTREGSGSVPVRGLPEHDDTRSLVLGQTSAAVALINHSAPVDDGFGSMFCGGVLIDSSVVLTAKHCVDEPGRSRIDALIGADNVCRTAPIEGERIPVRAIHLLSGDRAALVLASASSVQPVKLLTANPLATPSERLTRVASLRGAGNELVAVGWGQAEVTSGATCRKTQVPLTEGPTTECRQDLTQAPFAVERLLCLKPSPDATRNTCLGDSGGPVLVPPEGDPQRTYLVGTTSWGTSCRIGAVGFYERADESLLTELDSIGIGIATKKQTLP